MAGCKKKHSAVQKGNFKQYALENRAVVNRVRRLNHLIKKMVNSTNMNLQNEATILQQAIQKAHFRRQKPKNSTLTNSTKTLLHIVKQFSGRGDKDLISSNNMQQGIAWLKLTESKRHGKTSPDILKHRIFSIRENLPDATVKQLEILRTNLKAA